MTTQIHEADILDYQLADMELRKSRREKVKDEEKQELQRLQADDAAYKLEELQKKEHARQLAIKNEEAQLQALSEIKHKREADKAVV